MESVEAKVACGAEWLDKEVPGWEEQIDLSTLDLVDSCQCILGQVYRSVIQVCFGCNSGFYHGTFHLGLNTFELGFSTYLDNWAQLDQAWVTLIKDRFDRGDLSGHRG